jgi:tetratricopeptide (TPR) repeat protein
MREENESGTVSRKKRIFIVLAYIVVGTLATGMLVGVKLIFEHTSAGQQNEMWVYGKLQGALSSIDTENPVALVDISGVPDEQDGKPILLDKIQEIIEALVKLQHRPLAIGIDVDFSPPPNGDIDDDDFLDFCLDKSREVPIFLAVGQNKAAPPEAWLGQDKYKELAAAVAINPDDTRKVPLWVRTDKQTEKLNTMSYALALKYKTRLPEPPSWIGWAVDSHEPEVDGPQRDEDLPANATVLTYGYRLVNYSKMDAMKIAAKESIKNTGEDYNDTLVIIGDVSRARDVFPVPGRQRDQAGSLLIGCATYALIKEPVFEFKPKLRLLLDFLIAGLIIAMVAVIRYRNPEGLFWLGKQALFIYFAIAFVITCGWLLMRLAGVMWLDFLLVAFALFLHPKLEKLIHRIWDLRASRRSPPPSSVAAISTEKVATALIVGILVCTATAQAQNAADLCQQRVAAVLVKLELDPKDKKKAKTCYLRENRKETGQRLSAGDVKKQLRAGQDVYCDKGCVLVLWLCGSRESYPMKKNLPKSYTVKNLYRAPGRIIDVSPGIPARPRISWFTWDNPAPKTYSVRTAAKSTGRSSGTMSDPQTFPSGGVSKTVPKPAPSPATLANNRVAGARASANTAARPSYIPNEREESSARFASSLRLGNEQREDKKYLEAEQTYHSAAKLVPADARPFHGLGNVYADQEKWKEAEDAYRHAISLDPYYPGVYLALAATLLQTPESANSADRLSQAETLVWKAAEILPQNEKAYDLLDLVLAKRDAPNAESEAAYRRVLRLNPRSVGTNLRLSALLWRSGRQAEAQSYLSVAESAASTSQELLRVAETLESRRQYDRAERLVRRALEVRPSDPRAHLIWGLIMIDRKHYLEAVARLKFAAAATPNDFVSHYLLGIAQLGSGNLAEAEQSLNAASKTISADEKETLALACWLAALGDAYSRAGRTTDAVRLYEQALSYDSDDRETSDKLSELRARLKN